MMTADSSGNAVFLEVCFAQIITPWVAGGGGGDGVVDNKNWLTEASAPGYSRMLLAQGGESQGEKENRHPCSGTHVWDIKLLFSQ